MSNSFFCRLFGCSSGSIIYSANIGRNQGFDAPESIDGLNDWTVDKEGQTEIYNIHHNLGLSNPDRQLHIVATTRGLDGSAVELLVAGNDSNSFTIITWASFTFIAVLHP